MLLILSVAPLKTIGTISTKQFTLFTAWTFATYSRTFEILADFRQENKRALAQFLKMSFQKNTVFASFGIVCKCIVFFWKKQEKRNIFKKKVRNIFRGGDFGEIMLSRHFSGHNVARNSKDESKLWLSRHLSRHSVAISVAIWCLYTSLIS